jgi:hypothetical protein
VQNFKFHYNYYICNKKILVAENHKAASTSIAKAILQKYYPNKKLATDLDFRRFHIEIPKAQSCVGKEVCVVVRDPIDRFISLVTFMGLIPMVDTIIDQLSALNNPDDIPEFQTPYGHVALNSLFHPQIGFATEAKKKSYFKYPTGLDSLSNKLGLETPLEKLNITHSNKIILNDDQIQKLSIIYQQDLNLYNELS